MRHADTPTYAQLLAENAELRASEELNRQTFQALPAQVAVIDRDGRIVRVNDAWTEFACANEASDSASVKVGANYLDVCRRASAANDADAARALVGIHAVLSGGLKQFSLEYACHSPEERRWFLLTVTPLGGGGSGGAVISHSNTTARRQAVEEMRGRERLLQDIIDGSTSPIFLKDRDGKFITINAALERMLGLSREDLKGKTDYDIAPRELADYWRSHDQKVMMTGKAIQVEEVADLPDGRHIFLADKFPLVGADGQAYGVGAISHDITARKRAEEALQRSGEQLRRAQEIAHLGSWELDLVANRLVWSDEVYRLFGFEPQEFRATYEAFLDRVHPDDRAKVDAAYSESLRANRDSYEVEHRIIRKDTGEIRIVHERCHHLRDAAGKIVRSGGMVHDITERKQAEAARRQRVEEALRLSEQEFRSLAEAVPQIVWATRPDGWNIYFNQRWVDYTGMTMEESSGHGWNTPFHPDDKQRAWEAWQRATRYNEPYSLECRLRRADGAYRWWLVRGSPMLGANGEILKWFGTCTDIEELKRAEAALRDANDLLEQRVAERTAALHESENRFRTMANAMPQLAWIARPDGHIFWYNQRWHDYTGTTPEQMEGWGWQSVHDPAELPKVLERWNVSIETEAPFEMTFPLRAADGSFRMFLTRGTPLKDEAGRVAQWFGTNTDVTELKRAEEALRASEERQRLVLQASETGTFEVDLVTGEGRWNAVEFELLGLKPGAAPDGPETFFRFVHPEDIAHLRAKWEGALRCGKLDAEFRVVRADGEVRWLAAKGQFIFEGQAEGEAPKVHARALRFMGVNFDITQRKAAERAIAQLNVELEQRVTARTDELATTNRELEAFCYSVSHDLRTPLRSMDGFSQALLEDYGRQLDATGKDLLNRIRSNCQRMACLIDDLLNLSRLTRAQMRPRPVDFTELAYSAIETLRQADPGRAVDVRIAPDLSVIGDPVLLGTVVSNLLENAWKYTRQRPDAVIEFGVERRLVPSVGQPLQPVFFVRDNGVGFDMRYADKLFTPFQRLHAMADFPGSGIGLATAQRVIQRHGGHIWFESAPGQGATFFFTLGANTHD